MTTFDIIEVALFMLAGALFVILLLWRTAIVVSQRRRGRPYFMPVYLQWLSVGAILLAVTAVSLLIIHTLIS